MSAPEPAVGECQHELIGKHCVLCSYVETPDPQPPAVAAETLTEAELDILRAVYMGWSTMPHNLRPAVGRILADRLAAQRADLTARLTDPDVIEAVLAAHVVIPHNVGYDTCRCGIPTLIGAEHRAHVAAAVRDALTGGAS